MMDQTTALNLTFWMSAFPGLLIGVVTYVFMALGLYSLSKRREISQPWFAWVPVTNSFLLGAVADDYDRRVSGKDHGLRKWLTALSIVEIVASSLFLSYIIYFLATMMQYAYSYSDYYAYSSTQVLSGDEEELMAMIGGILVVSLLFMLFAIACAVVQYIALYKVYKSCDPRYATLYTVLSIVISGTAPFFVFACRKKDFGLNPPAQMPFGGPMYGQPMYGQPAAPYGQPMYGQPASPYGQPMQGQPAAPYGQPMQGQPAAPYGQPMQGQPAAPYGQPMQGQPAAPYGQPMYGQPASPYGQPMQGQPAAPYGQPMQGQPAAPYGQPMQGQPAAPYGQTAYTQPVQPSGVPGAENPSVGETAQNSTSSSADENDGTRA